MSRTLGTVARGVRTPIFREGDNVVEGVVSSVLALSAAAQGASRGAGTSSRTRPRGRGASRRLRRATSKRSGMLSEPRLSAVLVTPPPY